MTLRQLALWGGLAASLASAAWVASHDSQETELAQPVVRRSFSGAEAPQSPASISAAPAQTASRLVRMAPMDWPKLSATTSSAWQPPPPPAPPPAPTVTAAPTPPPPQPAPSFPYQWIGRLDEGGVAHALLSGALRGTAVRPGDVLDNQWRIDRIEPAALHVTWLPEQKTMTIVYAPR